MMSIWTTELFCCTENMSATVLYHFLTLCAINHVDYRSVVSSSVVLRLKPQICRDTCRLSNNLLFILEQDMFMQYTLHMTLIMWFHFST